MRDNCTKNVFYGKIAIRRSHWSLEVASSQMSLKMIRELTFRLKSHYAIRFLIRHDYSLPFNWVIHFVTTYSHYILLWMGMSARFRNLRKKKASINYVFDIESVLIYFYSPLYFLIVSVYSILSKYTVYSQRLSYTKLLINKNAHFNFYRFRGYFFIYK